MRNHGERFMCQQESQEAKIEGLVKEAKRVLQPSKIKAILIKKGLGKW